MVFPEPSLYESAWWLFWIDGEIAYEMSPGEQWREFYPRNQLWKIQGLRQREGRAVKCPFRKFFRAGPSFGASKYPSCWCLLGPQALLSPQLRPRIQRSPDPEKLWRVSHEPRPGATAKVEGRKKTWAIIPRWGSFCPGLDLTHRGAEKQEGGACRTRKASDRTKDRGRMSALTEASHNLRT